MSGPTSRTALATVAERLRAMVREKEDGDFLGNEETLIAQLGCSRSTIRQVARLLESEGLLKVRAGINGGYFSARPGADTIHNMVATYLDFLDIDREDVLAMASALWVEAMRKASVRGQESIESIIAPLQRRLRKVKDTATFADIRDLEVKFQKDIFCLAESSYIELIFNINVAYSKRAYGEAVTDDESPDHSAFVTNWRNAKKLELEALIAGDSELAVLAAQHSRKIWHNRIRKRFP
ncbi:MAG: FadR family transcriptional regulator [Novosphingobium sp.]|nr:FadR family transcriptional regulator [Novosphingobium sp.]MCP5403417.1 FadR family transcriptional regulator [Novosphingobium sp.]